MADGLTWMAAWELRALMVRGDVSPVEVCDHFLARIEEHDGVLHTCSHVDADGARTAAQAACWSAAACRPPVTPTHRARAIRGSTST